MELRQAIVARIRGLCEERQLKPYRWARKAAIPPNTMTSVLDGSSKNPGIITIKKLCDGIDLSVDDFFDHELFHALGPEPESTVLENQNSPEEGAFTDIHSAIAERIYQLSHERRLPPGKWGVLAGFSTDAVKRIFYGYSKNTSIKLIKSLCDVIGMSLVEFFDHELFYNLEPEVEHEEE